MKRIGCSTVPTAIRPPGLTSPIVIPCPLLNLTSTPGSIVRIGEPAPDTVTQLSTTYGSPKLFHVSLDAIDELRYRTTSAPLPVTVRPVSPSRTAPAYSAIAAPAFPTIVVSRTVTVPPCTSRPRASPPVVPLSTLSRTVGVPP